MSRGRAWHIVTCEYPPQVGGVSDHTRLLSAALADAGEPVHVWCPASSGETVLHPGVTVHRECGRFSRGDLHRVGELLDRCPSPRRLFVQWVPHGYGQRSMNVGLCRWLLRRARKGDQIDLMVHEPFLSFGEGSWRRDAAAVVHRAMMLILLRAATRVWVSTSSWIPRLRPFAVGRDIPLAVLPIGSSVPVVGHGDTAAQVRARYVQADGVLVGHFGTHGAAVMALVGPAMMDVLGRHPEAHALLIGVGSAEVRDGWVASFPTLRGRVHATGVLPSEMVSSCISACNVMLQLYPDGVTCRRTTALAALSHGVALVANDGRLTEDCWRDSGIGLLPTTANLAEAAGVAVEALLGSPRVRQERAAAGHKLYEAHLSLEHAVRALRPNAA